MLLYKTVPHNFEIHFEDKLFDTRPLQFLDLDADYIEPDFKDMLLNYESAVFDEWWPPGLRLILCSFSLFCVALRRGFFFFKLKWV